MTSPTDRKRKLAAEIGQIHNERLKLRANYLNGMAIATFAVGTLAPVLSLFYGAATDAHSPWAVLFVSLVCLIASLGLHYAARRILKGLLP